MTLRPPPHNGKSHEKFPVLKPFSKERIINISSSYDTDVDNDRGDLCDHITCDIIEVMKPYLLFSQSHHMKIMIIILKKVKVKFISNDQQSGKQN